MKLLTTIDAFARAPKPLDMFSALRSGEIKENAKGMFEVDKNSVLASALDEGAGPGSMPLDFHGMIRQSAKALHISDDPRDYLVVPVPALITDVPNSNGVAFPAKEMASWSVESGCPRYATWKGKPTYLEHSNQDPTKAKGIILDSVMNKVKNRPGFYKVMILASFDRTKDRLLYQEIASGNANAYSMGASVERYRCSYCHASWTPRQAPTCNHISNTRRVNFYELAGKLVYKQAIGVTGFEISSVANPSWSMAVSDFVDVIDPELRDKYGRPA